MVGEMKRSCYRCKGKTFSGTQRYSSKQDQSKEVQIDNKIHRAELVNDDSSREDSCVKETTCVYEALSKKMKLDESHNSNLVSGEQQDFSEHGYHLMNMKEFSSAVSCIHIACV
ncbi:Hypothetical predicted protein [Paramuricea clavata]|uniref:Uncharacterized protein n=1 Tax=Paramuricea clavata TaxID=317549 RepID=A0A7D9DKQ9_PARCT|nr:Hypothetical predicted protein [Paramuricea clavata]